MKDTKAAPLSVAAAISMGAGGAVAIDQTEKAVPVACELQEAPIANLDTVIREYRVDEGFLRSRAMSSSDRASIKGCEIAKAAKPGRHIQNQYRIEIVDIEPIDGGVQVFARAWRGGEQIGFGEDGSVDIERFRIFNPPVLVPDENGDIVRVQAGNEELGIATSSEIYREDPKAALVQIIASNLDAMHLSDGRNIEKGKVGRTTSTFYPDAGTGGTTVDGQLNRGAANNTWQSYRDGAGTGAFPSNNPIVLAYLRTNGSSVNLIVRSAFTFDTSAIPDTDTISTATFSTYVTAISNATGHGGLSVSITKMTLAADNNLANGDYAITNFGSAVVADTPFTSYSASAYYDHTLTDLSAINLSGITRLGALTSAEKNNTPPSLSSSLTASISINAADQTGTTQDPKLVVEHTAGGGADRRIIPIH